MFVLGATQSYTWPVEFRLAADEGKIDTHKFTATFKRLTASRMAELHNEITDGKNTVTGIVKEVLIGWKGVVDDSGADVPFTDAFRDKLLEIPNVAPQIFYIFMDSVQGKVKN